MSDHEKRARNRKTAEETIIYVTGLIALFAVLLLLSLLTGCSSREQAIVYDSDQCLEQNKRAAMICRRGSCYIECRDRN